MHKTKLAAFALAGLLTVPVAAFASDAGGHDPGGAVGGGAGNTAPHTEVDRRQLGVRAERQQPMAIIEVTTIAEGEPDSVAGAHVWTGNIFGVETTVSFTVALDSGGVPVLTEVAVDEASVTALLAVSAETTVKTSEVKVVEHEGFHGSRAEVKFTHGDAQRLLVISVKAFMGGKNPHAIVKTTLIGRDRSTLAVRPDPTAISTSTTMAGDQEAIDSGTDEDAPPSTKRIDRTRPDDRPDRADRLEPGRG